MTNEMYLAILRHALTGVGVYLAAQGIITEAQFQGLVGASLSIVGILLTVRKSRQDVKKKKEALNLKVDNASLKIENAAKSVIIERQIKPDE